MSNFEKVNQALNSLINIAKEAGYDDPMLYPPDVNEREVIDEAVERHASIIRNFLENIKDKL